ncbi:hypothetical protein HMPREF0973_02672 [Prevotella veroralis F0319]|uniref:Uncharacterized protein n=1 Tax=Prevotella veroralis F0319 TaxID=649761 RepID=C9MSQ3_9BACT|nr:hypothetical protein HMPREF0973_02672 [Prevotella veroralis F0319]
MILNDTIGVGGAISPLWHLLFVSFALPFLYYAMTFVIEMF